MHELLGYCDQAGQGTPLGECPAFWQPITDALPDKLALAAMLVTVEMLVLAARRRRSVHVFVKLLTEMLGLWSVLVILRASVVGATIMPAPSPLCRNTSTWEHGPGGRPTKGWFLTPIDCNDAMFSGHTSTYRLRGRCTPSKPFNWPLFSGPFLTAIPRTGTV